MATLRQLQRRPLGGLDRRALMARLAEHGPRAARQLLAADLEEVRRAGAQVATDMAIVLLGGSNGLGRALAVQLLFGEQVAVVAVHHDHARTQIGPHHARALTEAAARAGRCALFFNVNAAEGRSIGPIIAAVQQRFRAVHLVNAIAAGVAKRHPKHGPTSVPDLDVRFDPLLQVPDFADQKNIRALGLVDVGVASEKEASRTVELMGSSTALWVEALATAGLLAGRESVVAFCDYDFPPDDPVYAQGPLADAKRRQRQSLDEVRERFGVRAVRLCYPPMPTTALGAIPGAVLLFALAAQILIERGQFQGLGELARATMDLWRPPFPDRELRLDEAFQRSLPELRARLASLGPDDFPQAISAVIDDCRRRTRR